MTAIAISPQEKVRKCVVDALESARDMEAAVTKALAKIHATGLDEELTDHIVREFAASEVARKAHQNRQGFKAVVTSRRTIENAVSYGVAAGILHSWMVDGIRLAEAGRDNLLNAAKAERDRARGHVVNAAFYEAVAAKLGKGKTVGEVLNEDQLSKMLRDAEGGVK